MLKLGGFSSQLLTLQAPLQQSEERIQHAKAVKKLLKGALARDALIVSVLTTPELKAANLSLTFHFPS